MPAVAYIGDGAHDEECGQQVESEDFCAHEDGGEERVRCSAKDCRIPESCRKREGNAHDCGDGCAEGCTDGEQRGHFAALESDRERDDGKQHLQNPVVGEDVVGGAFPGA